MVFYDYNSSATLAEPLKSKATSEIVCAYTNLHKIITDHGLRPQLAKLNKECPAALKQFFSNKNMSFQLVPPYSH